MTTIKSVHIKECWPYEYVAPDRIAGKRRVFKRETMDRANARKREIYHAKKKLLQLQVFELDIDFCKELNNGTR
jgi:hypothetical protein